ncbi:Alkaline phosphatase precursor [Luteitalea pratensis]|uniref:Alkaline phosphatase n=1 Tax=Luteitalea pratensis TaxID=1855912 RepID=A0A143PUQ0_LUTPR|nr:metallophosphoesterase [Luteitalea pratensis]AMY12036.1 Alkaline phosphatase precursor [Luteitalea pratensis]
MRRPACLGASVLASALLFTFPAAPATAPWPEFTQAAAPAREFSLPNRSSSLKFFVLGDFGTGSRQQYALGERMATVHRVFPATLVITVGDNIYGGERPQDFTKKFEEPYRELLERGVKFHASLGNHDAREQSHYAPFNMGGRTYHSFDAPRQDVKFIAIESDYPTPKQIAWLKEELASRDDWIIPYFHHPLYSSGRRHGPHLDLRATLEPLFLASNVTVVFAGHEHFYERTKPQRGITHFIVGSGGQLRKGNLDPRSSVTARGFDTDRAFLAVEIDGDELFFNAIDTAGAVVDSGQIARRKR